MKRNLLGVFAVVTAIALSSFSVARVTTFYFVYGSGAHNVRANYSETTATQSAIGGANNIPAWIKVVDSDDIVTDTEFNNIFDALDVTDPNANSLSDEPQQTITVNGQSVQYEKKP